MVVIQVILTILDITMMVTTNMIYPQFGKISYTKFWNKIMVGGK